MTDLATNNKQTYTHLHDAIITKRFRSPSPIRRYVHHSQYQAFVEAVPAGTTVLDAGCGEGVLSVLLAKKGCRVTGVDLSMPNIVAAKEYAASEGVSDLITFLEGDAESLPVPDKSFDVVVSSHVLEHLPDFEQGARELARVARTSVIVAIPTCLNLASLVLLGGDKYWCVSRRTPYAWFVGGIRILLAVLNGSEGVNETYAGNPDLIHIHRFPLRGAKRLMNAGLTVERFHASSFPIPYIPFLVPVSRLLHRFTGVPFLRQLGFGTTYICRP